MEIVLQALRTGDLGKAHEVVSILLVQGITLFWQEHPVTQHFPELLSRGWRLLRSKISYVPNNESVKLYIATNVKH